MINTNRPLFGTKAVSKASDQRHKRVLADIRNINFRMDENNRLNFQPVKYTSDRVVRVQYIRCADNSLLIFPQFINIDTILI